VQKEVRSGLAALDFIGREDPPSEPIPQPGQAEGETHLLVAPAGGNAGWRLDPFKSLDDPRHGGQLAPKAIPNCRVELRLPSLGERAPQALGENAQRRRHAQAEEITDTFLVAHLQAER